MPLAQLIDVSLAFGHVPLLDHASLVIEPSSRIGLIGRNGTGKSTLLKLLAGIASTDDGEVWLAPGLKLAYVPQEPTFEAGHSVYEAVAEGLGEARAVMVEYHALTHSLGDDAGPAQLERLHDLQEALDAHDGWTLQHRIDGIVSKLDLPAERRVEELSGGLKKRVALARAWVMEPDLLLIDEPTNHLDIPGIEWLEQTLASFRGSVLCVTHDRRFLDSVAQQIVELDRGHLSAFPGNFSAFQVRKAEALEAEAQADRQFDKVLAQEEVWIRKGIQARRTRNEGRVLRLEALRRERAARRERVGRVELAVDAGDRSGKLVAELDNVSKRFGERTVVRDFSARLLRGDKVGLIGPNGSGKTTLLKLILGQLQPDEGKVHLGTKIEVAYFDQFRAALEDDATLVDTISQGSDTIEIGGRRKHVIGYLEEFLFPPERARAQVKSLSGGERNRLLLARLFSRPANVLVLDEPTNDLDVETLELLEELLQDYSGTLFLVSHDRTFLDNVVTQTIAYEGDGAWKEYAGGYSDWEKVRTRPETDAPVKVAKADKASSVEPARPAVVQAAATPKSGLSRLNAREKRELEELPAKLEALEQEHAGVQQRLADPALYQSDAAQVKTVNERNAELERAIAKAYARWEDLEARREAAAG